MTWARETHCHSRGSGNPAKRLLFRNWHSSNRGNMATKTYDAIVIGSGITGGWAAKELTEKGLDVLLLEAGRNMDPNKDYSEHKMPYDVKYRGLTDLQLMEEHYIIQRQCYECRE